jgi:hypothetical protein
VLDELIDDSVLLHVHFLGISKYLGQFHCLSDVKKLDIILIFKNDLQLPDKSVLLFYTMI